MFKRRVREAIEIFFRAPSLNRDAGYELPAIYWGVLSRDSQYKSRDKSPTLSLDNDSAMESKTCVC